MPYIGNTPALDYISYAVQNFTVTAGTTNYALDYSVANENDIRLVINNVIQRPGASFAYSATGTTLTLTSATLATDTMYAVFIGRAVQTVTPPTSSVTNTMLTPSVITGQTAETSVAGGDLVLIYDDSATALRKMTKTNLFSGVAVNAPAFSVYRNGNQTVSDTTTTKIQFNTEDFDTNSNFDSTTNYRFTPTVAGYYQLNLQLTLDNNGSGAYYEAYIYKNGSVVRKASATGQTLNSIAINLSEIIYLNGTTDYAEGFGMVSGTYLVFVGNTADKTRFSGALIRTG
jgi:hypothetical protein